MKHLMLAAAALIAVPGALAAQDTAPEAAAVSGADSDGMDEAMAKLRGMFPAEPLTAEQQARLPAAERLIARIMPADAGTPAVVSSACTRRCPLTPFDAV